MMIYSLRYTIGRNGADARMSHQSSSPYFPHPICDSIQLEQRRMPRNGGFTALSNALYVPIYLCPSLHHLINIFYRLCLSFLPSSLLALQLNKPTRSYDGKMIYLKWTMVDKDPETIWMQIFCVWPLFSQQSVQTSLLRTSFEADPNVTYDYV